MGYWRRGWREIARRSQGLNIGKGFGVNAGLFVGHDFGLFVLTVLGLFVGFGVDNKIGRASFKFQHEKLLPKKDQHIRKPGAQRCTDNFAGNWGCGIYIAGRSPIFELILTAGRFFGALSFVAQSDPHVSDLALSANV